MSIQETASRWQTVARRTLATAKSLRENNDYRSCVSRAYYAAYQAATSVCVAHGDTSQFPAGWNNPSHEQLPELIANNGDLTLNTRRTIKKILRELRILREDADYRPGRTINNTTVKNALLMVDTLFVRLEIPTDEP